MTNTILIEQEIAQTLKDVLQPGFNLMTSGYFTYSFANH